VVVLVAQDRPREVVVGAACEVLPQHPVLVENLEVERAAQGDRKVEILHLQVGRQRRVHRRDAVADHLPAGVVAVLAALDDPRTVLVHADALPAVEVADAAAFAHDVRALLYGRSGGAQFEKVALVHFVRKAFHLVGVVREVAR